MLRTPLRKAGCVVTSWTRSPWIQISRPSRRLSRYSSPVIGRVAVPPPSVEPSTCVIVTLLSAGAGAPGRPLSTSAAGLEPAAAAEEREQPAEDHEHEGEHRVEGRRVVLTGHVHVHPPHGRDQRQGKEDHREGGEDADGLRRAVRDGGLVGGLERLHDLLVVLEHVPHALGGVDDVVEVDVEVVGDVALLVALEVAERGALRTDHLAEVDDLLLGVREIAHDLGGAALEDALLDALELVADLAEHRERGVDAVVDDLVEQVAGALGEDLLAQLLVGAAALEQVLDRLQGLVRERDEEVGADEEVELGCVQPRHRLVVAREVQDDEEVVVVLVDLRALVAREHVLVVEGMELEALLEPRAVGRPRALDVVPAEAGGLDDLDARLLALRCARRLEAAARAATTEGCPRDAGHARDSVGRRSASSGFEFYDVAATSSLRTSAGFATVWRAVRIQRGGGTGPTKPRQPSGRPRPETVAIPSGSKTTAWEMRWRASHASVAHAAGPGREDQLTDAGRGPEVQGVLHRLSARGALRL